MKILFLLHFSLFFLINCINCQSQCFDKNCLTCTSNDYGKCTSCASDFKLISGTCVCYDPNCLECDSSLFGACTLCKPNFILYYGQCYCSISHCLVCSETGCSQCLSGYSLNDDNTLCIEDNSAKIICNDNKCISCMNSQEGACVACEDGYYTEKGKCIQSPPCEETIVNGKCEKCPSGFYSLGEYCYPKCMGQPCNNVSFGFGSCESTCFFCYNNDLYEFLNCKPQDGYCFDEHCTQCLKKERGYCERCEVGYYKLNGECKPCDPNLQHCLKCDYSSNNAKCSVCINNYDLQLDGTCLLNTTSRDTYPSNKRTSQSESSETTPEDPGQKPVEDQSSVKCIVQNCEVCSKKNFCISCRTGFEAKNGKCLVPCNIENCEACSEENICEKCISDYELQDDNTCKLQCKDKNGISCITSKWCISCIEGYTVSGVGCTPICDDINCSYCTSSSSCVTCSPGYTVVGYKCEPCDDSNCQICSSTEHGTCTTCKFGYLLTEGICSEKCEKIPKCEYCIDNQTKCVACHRDCTLKDGKCSCFNAFLLILLLIIGVVLIGFGIFCYIGFRKKKEQQDNFDEQIPEFGQTRQGMQMISIAASIHPSARLESKPEKLSEKYEEEFLHNRLETQEKELGVCDYCNCKPAKYLSDCGCKLCKDHSKPLKDLEEDGNNKKCPKCMKIVNKIQLRKGKCGICLQDKLKLAKFKCHCALMVCKECYIKCKVSNSNCPACRKPIN